MGVVDEIKSRLDIVDTVSEYVSLQKAGRNFKALCPFHTEKTASFVVNPERQSWHCFGACATGGDAFSFVMRKEGLEFGEALRLLSEKAGVPLGEKRDGGLDEGLHRINLEAARFYQQVLASSEGKQAMDYLTERGVDSQMLSAFLLGLSPRGGGRLVSHLTSLGFRPEQAIEAGLLRRDENGGLRDFFWGRLMFPIHDRRGRVAGFGGRTLDGSDPKYLNTPATPIFDKRSILYGLPMALTSIGEQNTVVIVEGYMDVIAAHQHGYTNVVASMGTALTDRQVSQLRSIAGIFVLALDPDAAGQEATLRSLTGTHRVLERRRYGQKAEFKLKIASLPVGKDPDAIIRESPQEWEGLVRDAVPYGDFLVPAIASKHDLTTPVGRARAANELSSFVTGAESAIEQDYYLAKIAQVLGVSREALEASIGRPRPAGYGGRERPSGRDPTRAPSESALSAPRQDIPEEYLLALLLARPELRERAAGLAPEYFRGTENREVFTLWLSYSTIEELQGHLDDSIHEHLDHLSRMELEPSDRRSAEAALAQSIRRLEQRHLQELQEGLLASEVDSLPPPRELEEQIVSVNARLKELFSQRS